VNDFNVFDIVSRRKFTFCTVIAQLRCKLVKRLSNLGFKSVTPLQTSCVTLFGRESRLGALMHSICSIVLGISFSEHENPSKYRNLTFQVENRKHLLFLLFGRSLSTEYNPNSAKLENQRRPFLITRNRTVDTAFS
jgi:hypothetical protein